MIDTHTKSLCYSYAHLYYMLPMILISAATMRTLEAFTVLRDVSIIAYLVCMADPGIFHGPTTTTTNARTRQNLVELSDVVIKITVLFCFAMGPFVSRDFSDYYNLGLVKTLLCIFNTTLTVFLVPLSYMLSKRGIMRDVILCGTILFMILPSVYDNQVLMFIGLVCAKALFLCKLVDTSDRVDVVRNIQRDIFACMLVLSIFSDMVDIKLDTDTPKKISE